MRSGRILPGMESGGCKGGFMVSRKRKSIQRVEKVLYFYKRLEGQTFGPLQFYAIMNRGQ